jgi:hypothetical protein
VKKVEASATASVILAPETEDNQDTSEIPKKDEAPRDQSSSGVFGGILRRVVQGGADPPSEEAPPPFPFLHHIFQGGSDLVNAVPASIERQANLFGSIVKALGEARPAVEKRVDSLDRMAGLITDLIRTSQDQLVKSVADFGSTFDRRLKCHADCSSLEGEEEKEKCEEANCNYFDETTFKFNEKPKPFDPDYDIEEDF